MAKNDDKQIIIIKRIKKGGGGHHGGAWKVAYADFVTAMMAFFLLLWLLNVTTDEQKMMISSYFAPTDPRISESTSGAGGVMGGTTISPDGAMTDRQASVTVQQEVPGQGTGKDDGEKSADEKKMAEELDKLDQKAFKGTEDKLKQALESVPELKELAQNLLVDMTPEGMRIQIVDQQGKPMFESGSARPLPSALKLLELIGKIITDLPNKISIRGHTDSKSYGISAAYTNWELSADRANVSRRIMIEHGLDIKRVENIQGKADREPLVASTPEAASNRRISIILLKQSLTTPLKKGAAKPLLSKAPPPPKPEPKKKEEGVIYFP